MTHGALARGLRITGIAAVMTVLLVTIAQMAFVEWWLITSPGQTEVVNQSGLRRAATYEVMYQAQRTAIHQATPADLRAAMQKLAALNVARGDLTSSERATYVRFEQAVQTLQTHPQDRSALASLNLFGTTLYAAFDRATTTVSSNAVAIRRRFANVVLTGGIATLLIVIGLYVFVMRPREAYYIKAIDAIEERRERFAALFEHTTEMMTLYRVDGTIVRANRAATAALGFGAASVGEPYNIHVAPNEREKVARHFARAVAGEASRFSTTFLDRAGRDVPVLASITPVMVRGNVTGVIGMARDISGEQAFQATLLRANERFRSLFRRSHRAIVALDSEGMIADANPALCEMTGYDEAELVGKSGLILAPPGDRIAARERMNELLTGSAFSYELMLHPRTGDDIAVQADATPIQVGGHVEGVFVTLTDLTRERALMRKLDTSDELVRALLQIATSSLDAGPQIDFALSVGARALNMQYGYVGTIRNDVLAIRHRYGPTDYLPLGHTMPVTKTVGARLVSSPHAIGVDDLTVEPFASELAERGLPWKSYVGSRITVDGMPYGVLVFISTEKRGSPFERTHIDFIDVMSGMMSAAIARESRHEP